MFSPSGAPNGATPATALLPAEAFDALEAQVRMHSALGRHVVFEGEVTDVRSRELLVASADWTFAVRVALPSVEGVRFGDWVRAQGTLTVRATPREASLQLSLVQASVERVGRSRRAASLNAEVRRYARPVDDVRRLEREKHVGIVSTQGHGLRDVLATLQRAGITHTLYEVDFSDSASIAAGIRRASDEGRIATLVTRGGGSRMELEPVNSVDVAAAALQSRAFTVLAVGHESDVFDVECAFDRTCGTPSKGASFFAAVARSEQQLKHVDDSATSSAHAGRAHAAQPPRRAWRRRFGGFLWKAGIVIGLVGLGYAFSEGYSRGLMVGRRTCEGAPTAVVPPTRVQSRPLPLKPEVSK